MHIQFNFVQQCIQISTRINSTSVHTYICVCFIRNVSSIRIYILIDPRFNTLVSSNLLTCPEILQLFQKSDWFPSWTRIHGWFFGSSMLKILHVTESIYHTFLWEHDSDHSRQNTHGINQQRNIRISLVPSSTHQTYYKNHVCCLFTHPSYIFYVHTMINVDKGTIPRFWSPLFGVLRSWVKANDSKVKCEGHTPNDVCEEKFSRSPWLVFALLWFCSKLFSVIQTVQII